MRVVTPAGISGSRRLPASGAGPSPDRLFLGSEGALGIITEAWMRLQDRPRWKAGTSLLFDCFDDGVAAVRAIVQSGLDPANCRLLDPAEAFLTTGVGTSGGVLVLGFESADHPVQPSLDRAWRSAATTAAPRGPAGERDRAAGAGVAVVVPAHAVPARRARAARHDRRDVRDGVHLGRVPGLHRAVTEAATDALRASPAAGR